MSFKQAKSACWHAVDMWDLRLQLVRRVIQVLYGRKSSDFEDSSGTNTSSSSVGIEEDSCSSTNVAGRKTTSSLAREGDFGSVLRGLELNPVSLKKACKCKASSCLAQETVFPLSPCWFAFLSSSARCSLSMSTFTPTKTSTDAQLESARFLEPTSVLTKAILAHCAA